jgi:sterol desaturase/sphingolipid hydroxylase (fatty acid hydroxylase superfamily)
MFEFFYNLFARLGETLLSMNSRLAIMYLAATVVLAYIIWWYRGKPQTFTQFVFPRAVYRHRSNLVDIKIFCFNLIIGVAGLLSVLTFTPAVTVLVLELLHDFSGSADTVAPASLKTAIIATVVMILTLDFCKYWAHYIHHESSVLWPFHSVHHSAEVLTPLTATRNHPVFLLIRSAIYSIVVGTAQAGLLFAVVGKIDLITIGSANVGYVLFNFLGSNLRHSHIWLSYGPMLEHIFISPAQHQIHHSSAVKHHNKNYGEVFAFWDWMFGTLYIPQKHEALTFGIADADGNLIEQPHPTLRAALINPFFESWQNLRKPRSAKAPEQVKQQ